MRRGIVDVLSLGCSKNLVDSERLLRQFQLNGYKVRHDFPHPNGEIVVVNTCGFIGDAKEESINTILSLAEAKKKGTIGRLFVMGCLAERYRTELTKEIPEVDHFYGKFDWKQLLNDIGKAYFFDHSNERVLTTPAHYAYVKIAEGCNRGCAYCAIPLITGHYKSRELKEIVQEVEELVQKGVKEIQLIAQDLTYYGRDLPGKENRLPELVERLSDIKGVEWIRLHYGYPVQFPMDLLRVIRERENVCNYLDIALQHINTNVLQRMRRNSTREETLELLSAFREVPNLAMRTTFMVGFPDETDEEFEELEEFVRTFRFERMGSFAYSEEEGTYAALHYKDNVPPAVKQERQSRLMQIQESISEEMGRKIIGKRLKTIIDREEEDYFIGRTEHDSPEVDKEVLIGKETPLRVGNFYEIEITDATAFDLFGRCSTTSK